MIIRKEQAGKAAEVLRDAFHPYIYFTSLIPDPEARQTSLYHIFRFLIKYGNKYGEVHVPSEKIEGAAIWIPSEKAEITFLRGATCGGISLFFKLNSKSRKKFDKSEELMIKKQFEIIKEPHWYLSMFGVDPVFKGKGYGGILLKEMIDRSKTEKKSIYTETQSKENVGIYEHFGFKVKEEFLLPEINLKCYGLVRDFSLKGSRIAGIITIK